MAKAGAITAEFGAAERAFFCGMAELRAIQEACGVGPPVIAERLARCVQVQRAQPEATVLDQVALGVGDWKVDDIREPILVGLIAAGMPPGEAGRLVRRWIDDRGFKGLMENAGTALTILVAGVAEPEGDPAGELPAGADSTTTPTPAA